MLYKYLYFDTKAYRPYNIFPGIKIISWTLFVLRTIDL